MTKTPLQEALEPSHTLKEGRWTLPPKPHQALRVALVLDRSGSMGAVADQVRRTLAGYAEENAGATLDLTQFSSGGQVTTEGGLDISHLRSFAYRTGGNTALYDAIASAIIASLAHPFSGKTLLAIVTDGGENDSRLWTLSEVKAALKLVEKLGWGVVFLGAGLDAVKESANLGVNVRGVASYATAQLMAQDLGQTLRMATTSYQARGAVDLGHPTPTLDPAQVRGGVITPNPHLFAQPPSPRLTGQGEEAEPEVPAAGDAVDLNLLRRKPWAHTRTHVGEER